MNLVTCAYRHCDIIFEPRRHNQVYCCSEHCREETNIRLKESYHNSKARRAGKKRICRTCDTVLSRYNDSNICSKCVAELKAAKAERDREIFERDS